MDVLCSNCAEPWELVYVIDNHGSFKFDEGGAMIHCPACPKEGSKLDPSYSAFLRSIYHNSLDLEDAALSFEDAESMGWL